MLRLPTESCIKLLMGIHLDSQFMQRATVITNPKKYSYVPKAIVKFHLQFAKAGGIHMVTYTYMSNNLIAIILYSHVYYIASYAI